MLKKLSILLIASTLILTFAACKKNDENSNESNESTSSEVSTVSETSSEANTSSKASAETSDTVSVEESTSETSSKVETSDVVDGVFICEEYNFTVPEGFTLLANKEGTTVFTDSNSSQLNIQVAANTLKFTTITKAQLEQTFATILGDTKLNNYKTTTVDGQNAVYFTFTLEASTIKVNTYSTIIFTDDNLITVSLAANNKDMSKSFDNMLKTFTIAD